MKFTIAIPAFKVKFLQEAIHSCLSQTFDDLEVVVVNDASPENLDAIMSRYDDPRIRYYKNEKNCGIINVVDNWNICLSHAHGNYIICMGDDDRLLPNCLEEYCKLMDKYPNLAVYHAMTELIDENSEFFSLQQPRPEYESAFSLAWNRWNGRNKQYIGDFCYDTKVLREDGGFFKLPMAWGSDDITAIRAAAHSGIANTQIPCFQYRVNRLNITSTGATSVKMEATMLEKQWFCGFINQNIDRHDLPELDKKFIACLLFELPKHYTEKFKGEMIGDLRKTQGTRLLHWLLRCKNYGLSKTDVLKCLAKSFHI